MTIELGALGVALATVGLLGFAGLMLGYFIVWLCHWWEIKR